MTTSLLTSAIWTFIKDGLFEDLRTDTITLDTAIEEVLRYRLPAQIMLHGTATEVKLYGTTIPTGERIIAWIESVNRGER